MKKLFILIFSILIFLSTIFFSHVKHYNKIKYLKYNLFLNNELIGYHIFDFIKKKILNVRSKRKRFIQSAIYKKNQLEFF